MVCWLIENQGHQIDKSHSPSPAQTGNKIKATQLFELDPENCVTLAEVIGKWKTIHKPLSFHKALDL
jgi:hypothetical protein